MPWVGPPPDVRRKVEDQLGDGIWEQLSQSWDRVAALDPQMRLTQWYRTPEQTVAERRRNPNAALYSQHALGLAVDVTPTAARRQAVIAEARRRGFFVRTYRTDQHLHISALSDPAWSRSALQAHLRRLLAPLLARPR